MAVAVAVLSVAMGCGGSAGPDGGLSEGTGRFHTSASCATCHPVHVAEWQRSMHAHAARSPVTLRLNELGQAQTGGRLGDDCLGCHAPVARLLGELEDPADPQLSEVGAEGVTCDLCHALAHHPKPAEPDLGRLLGPPGTVYGGLADPEPTPAHTSERRQLFGDSDLCSACHQVSAVPGRELGNTFLEWERSGLAAQGVGCQTCHMPEYTGPAAVDGPIREGLHRHTFAGVESALRPNPGLDRERQRRDAARVLAVATRSAVEGMPSTLPPSGELAFEVAVLNQRAGHSIPSGTSFWRQMWLSVTVRDAGGERVYESGALGPGGDLIAGPEAGAVFGAALQGMDGGPTWYPWRAAGLDESGLLGFGEERRIAYAIDIPDGAAGPLQVDLALRYRPFAPALLREIGLEELLPIEVFDLWERTHHVALGPSAVGEDEE